MIEWIVVGFALGYWYKYDSIENKKICKTFEVMKKYKLPFRW